MAGAGVLVVMLALITTTAWAGRTAVAVGQAVAAGSEV
jgi:hypothetical protein